MKFSDDVDDLKAYRICPDCVGESYLSAKIEKSDERDTCTYCQAKDAPTISVEELADEIAGAFERHYEQRSTEPDGIEYAMSKEFGWSRHGDLVADVIAEAAEIDGDPAEHVRLILEHENEDFERAQMGEEGPFDDDTHYQEAGIDDHEFAAQWEEFEQSLKTQTRFFNNSAQAILDMLFEGIAEAKRREGAPVIRTCGTGTDVTHLYRARVFQSEEMLKHAIASPDSAMGAPPTNVAAAGRMNARGISVFYGATDPSIAIAEVRPPVGSRVVIARFEFLRPVRLLDVAALQNLLVKGSIFDPAHARELRRGKFLRRLSARITMSVMPEDETMQHIVTQAMADYLAERKDLDLDGILYGSVQSEANGHNVALFHRAARCEALDLPKGSKVQSHTYMHTEDGFEPDCMVWEEVPADVEEPKKEDDSFPDLGAYAQLWDRGSQDDRKITLRVDAKSLEVHEIKAVKFTTSKNKVRRHRTQSRPDESDDF